MMKRVLICMVGVVLAVSGCSRSSEHKAPEGAMLLGPGTAGVAVSPAGTETMLLRQGEERVLALPGATPGQKILMKISEIQICEQTPTGWVCAVKSPVDACDGCTVISCNCAKKECASMCGVVNSMKMFTTPGGL